MSKTIIMCLQDAKTQGASIIKLGLNQIKQLEKELEFSHEKEDYLNMSEFREIKIFKSDKEYDWEIIEWKQGALKW